MYSSPVHQVSAIPIPRTHGLGYLGTRLVSAGLIPRLQSHPAVMEPGNELLDDVMQNSLTSASHCLPTGSGGQVGSTSVASGRSTSAASGKSLSSIPEKQEKIPTPLSESITSLLCHQGA